MFLEDIHGSLTGVTEQDKAVALAEKHGGQRDGPEFGGPAKPLVTLTNDQLTAMLADHEQQVIQRLVDESGVMPEEYVIASGNGYSWCATEDVRKAIASLQAKAGKETARADQAENDLRRIRAAMAIKGGNEHYPTEWAYLQCCKSLDAEKARVRELEKDAARYRFLRDADRSEENCPYEQMLMYAMESLDEAIDAAMKKEGGV